MAADSSRRRTWGQVLWQAFRDAGTLLEIGPFADVQSHRSTAIFTSGEAAREFAESDPFERVVARWEIREWNEALQPE